MPICGVERAIYGVEDLEASRRFYDDFGLQIESASSSEIVYRLEEGSRVVLRLASDPSLPAPHYAGSGVRETVFGVDTQAEIDAFQADLARDRPVNRDDDGTIHFTSDCGIPLALRVFGRKKVLYSPDPVNAPDNIKRLNQHRRWRVRALPKTINHIVWRSMDIEASWAFFRDRLNFRLSDVQVDAGIFGRAPGVNQHHLIYFQRYNALGPPPHSAGFDHICYGVEDIDEVYAGWNYMERRGWKNPLGGVGRHRIASALFCYLEAPCGGNAEYGADTDYLDDSWVPRVWAANFGGFMWTSGVLPFLPEEVEWKVTFDQSKLPKGEVPAKSNAPAPAPSLSPEGMAVG
jgi:catechol 2,3-dioxygenase-like lactoylglutathione lyase family enzyme